MYCTAATEDAVYETLVMVLAVYDTSPMSTASGRLPPPTTVGDWAIHVAIADVGSIATDDESVAGFTTQDAIVSAAATVTGDDTVAGVATHVAVAAAAATA